MTEPRWLVVGLGNPPSDYAGTRHNVGAETVEALASRLGTGLTRTRRIGCRTAETRTGDVRLVLAVPEGYMNESGRPVASAATWFKVAPAQVIVVHDDLDLAVGSVRVKRGGGHGGHNGLRDIDRALTTNDYLRVRIGIGRPPGTTEARDHVLRRPSSDERAVLDDAIARAADAVTGLALEGLEATQNRLHAPGDDTR